MATPLVLVVHGRAGGLVPRALRELADDLQVRRQAPVVLQALTAPCLPAPDSLGRGLRTLVPLMLLPGGHVRVDVPAIAAHWRSWGPVRKVPFVGAWPSWQRVLAAELAGGPDPLLLHHPVHGALAQRYLDFLATQTGSRLVPAPYSDSPGTTALTALNLANCGPVLPLALAANRLTDSLGSLVGPPLIERKRFAAVLMEQLEALP